MLSKFFGDWKRNSIVLEQNFTLNNEIQVCHELHTSHAFQLILLKTPSSLLTSAALDVLTYQSFRRTSSHVPNIPPWSIQAHPHDRQSCAPLLCASRDHSRLLGRHNLYADRASIRCNQNSPSQYLTQAASSFRTTTNTSQSHAAHPRPPSVASPSYVPSSGTRSQSRASIAA